MKHLRTSLLSLALLGGLAVAPSSDATASGFSFGTPNYYSVALTAGGGQYAGTESTLWVRIYSETQSSWSGWKVVAGPESGETVTVGFEMSPSFSDVAEVQVFEGQADGARLTVDVHDSNGDFFEFSPEDKWVKNGSAVFERYIDPVPLTVNCHASPAHTLLCMKIKATCDSIHENNPNHGCGCSADGTTCDTD